MSLDDVTFRFDLNRHLTGAGLSPDQSADFQRLVKDLRFGGRFQLLIVECIDWTLRERLIRSIADVLKPVGLTAGRIALETGQFADLPAIEIELGRLASDHQLVHLTGGEQWFDDARMEAFNLRREAIAQSFPVHLLLWLDQASVRRLALLAPDWWAWRGGVFAFLTEPAALPVEPPRPQLGPIDTRSLAKRSRRISELRAFLNSEPPPPDNIALPLWDELAGLLASLGQLDEALHILSKDQLPVCERLGNVRSKAVTQGQIADILQARGQLDEALRIRTEDVLPVFDRLGDLYSKAVTQGKIADIRQARGQLDEALRIRTEDELPVYERLGDLRSKAVTQGKIADIPQARGQLDEALRIYTDQLPIYELLGDLRSKAVTQGKIAEILQARGQLDEALRIRTEEQIPVFERLGDVRSKAVTQGYIADILQARGQLDEALRIRTEDELPVYERLGDVRGESIVLFKISVVEQDRGQQEQAFEHLAEAYRLVESGGFADGLAVVGEWYGRLLCERGERERGLEVLGSARQAALLLGQHERTQRIDEWLGT